MANRYAGVGYRKTPATVLMVMKKIGYRLARKGYVLSSGAAEGPDSTFEAGCDYAKGEKEIWLPWKGFNKHTSQLLPKKKHFKLAEEYHPGWKNMTPGTKALMARNVGEILGENADDPVDFVVCYTEDGVEHHSQVTSKSGGTGFAISIASRYGIPVFNLRNPEALSKLKLFLDEYRIFEE